MLADCEIKKEEKIYYELTKIWNVAVEKKGN